jgi:DNA repair protein RadD
MQIFISGTRKDGPWKKLLALQLEFGNAKMVELRPYQVQLLDDIRDAMRQGHRRILAVMPTGAGKGTTIGAMVASAAVKGKRTLVLAHRAELIEQLSKTASQWDVRHGLIQANRSMDLSVPVQIGSVQTVARRLHKLPTPDIIIQDEAHHLVSGNTWGKIIDQWPDAYLIGKTATPTRLSGEGLGAGQGGYFTAMVLGPSAAWLTDHGFLARARVLAPPGFDTAGIRKRMSDFDTREAEQRVGTIMGDCLSHYRKHLSGQTAIAFCCSVAHAEAVAQLFMGAGIPAASIDGSMDGATRRDLLQALGTGRIKVLTSCALIGEGVDVPSVGGCVLLRPTQSVSLHLQMIGRCLRPSPGKTAVILDHVGNTLRLGHHLEPREWTLEGIAKRDRDKAPSVKVCPQCFAAMASQARQCLECGHQFAPEVRELQQVEGDLVEIAARERKREQGTAQSLDDLRQLAQQRGYKRGWAERVYQARLAKRYG